MKFSQGLAPGITYISKSSPIFQCRNPLSDVCNMSRRMDHGTAYDLDRINKIYRIEG